MMRNLLFLFVFLVPFALNAQENSKSTEQFLSEIDKKIPQLLQDFLVPGAAIGIIENGEIVLQKGYGFADVEKEVKVDTKTGFNIGSISKTIAAWGVMKLVDEGKIDLDAPAEKYLTRWHLPESEFDSDKVTIRRLLSHTAGLSLHGYPGWSPKDTLPTIEESLNGKNNGPGRVEIIMEPGTKYKYSGGGYSILQLIIEEVTGQKFEDYMQAQILEPLGMNNSSYKIDDKIMAASASGYDKFGEAIDFELFTAQAAAGFHTTIEDFTRFAYANLYRTKNNKKNNPILPGNILQQMMVAVPQAEGRYGYGLAYFVESIPGTSVILNGHRGANTGWHAIFLVNPETNDGFIMITNGGAGHQVYSHILYDWTLWQMGVQLEDWHQTKPPISKKLKSIIDNKGIDDIATSYAELKKNQAEKYDFEESQLNQFGYYYMGKGELEKAIAIFKLNAEAFPNSWIVYDSYGEALLKKGERGQAIENYKKSIKLNPGNEQGIKVLKELGVSTEDLMVKVPIEHLKRLAGEYTMIYNVGWELLFEVVNEELVWNDGDQSYRILPVGDNEFVNTHDASSMVFDTKDLNAITLVLSGKYKFWKTGVSKPSIARKLLNIIDSIGIDNISDVYTGLKKNHPDKYDFSESQLNSLGYYYINKNDLEKATTILKLNTETFPDAFNTYDSYGEVLLANGAREEGIENYRKSIKLNPGNEHGIKMLNGLGVSTEDLIVNVTIEQLNLLAGEYIMTEDEEWKLVFEVVNEELVGKDGDYKFRLFPSGDNEFIIPDDGDSWVFDTKDQNAISLMFSEKYKFEKVK